MTSELNDLRLVNRMINFVINDAHLIDAGSQLITLIVQTLVMEELIC